MNALTFPILAASGLLGSLWFQHGGIALLLGMTVASLSGGRQIRYASAVSTYTLQIGVVLLGFGLSLSELNSIGQSSIWLVAASVVATLVLGYLLGRLLKSDTNESRLLAGGTAICGGTAVVTLAPAINASARQVSHVLPVIYVLNALAMALFPLIADTLELSAHQIRTVVRHRHSRYRRCGWQCRHPWSGGTDDRNHGQVNAGALVDPGGLVVCGHG
jgi:uncharacterized membrane protein YadS